MMPLNIGGCCMESGIALELGGWETAKVWN